MTLAGSPPSCRNAHLIESDPVLRRLAEQAATSGDYGPLQEAATRRLAEIVRDNPGEFAAEELQILRQASGVVSSGSGEREERPREADAQGRIEQPVAPPAPC